MLFDRETISFVWVVLLDSVAQGKYQNEEAEVVDGIRLLMGREKLRNEIQLGIEQLDRGESCDGETTFAEVNAVIDEIEASQQSK